MKVLYIKKKHLFSISLFILAVFFLIVNITIARNYVREVNSPYRQDIPIYSVESEGKKCAITFDCAWGADDIPRLLDILDSYKAKATFFIVGTWAEKYPDVVRLMAEKGHEVANHGYSHQHMAQIPEEKIKEEITRCTELLEKITGQEIKLFRAPYGEYNSLTVKSSRELEHEIIQWDVDSLDWRDTMSKKDIYDRVVKRVVSGSIILFHNDTQYTEGVLPDILENLTQNGFESVTVSDLLLKENYKIRYDGKQVRE